MLPKPVQSGVPSAWQFGLPAMFALTAGVALALGLIRLDVNWGTLAAVFLVGSSWAYLTRRAGHRRLAYHLAAVAMGPAAYLVLSLPISPVTHLALFSGTGFFDGDQWPHWIPTVAMSATCWLTAHILQKPICRRNSRVFGRFLGVATRACFLGCFVFMLIVVTGWILLEIHHYAIISTISPTVGDVIQIFFSSALLLAIGSPLTTVFSLPIAVPMAMAFVATLNRIGLQPHKLNKLQKDTLDAIRQLQQMAIRPVSVKRVAEHLGRAPDEIGGVVGCWKPSA